MINEEGKRRVEELKKEWVINNDELALVAKQRLLTKLYECQSEFEALDKKEDSIELAPIVKRLELDLEGYQQII